MTAWGERLIFFDGAMGTRLQAAGLGAGEAPETWNLLHPDRVRAVHTAYLDAGCDVVTANTFGANRLRLGDGLRPCVAAGVRLAREACRAAGHGLVALDMGPTGRLLQPMGDLPFEEAVGLFREAAEAGAAAGADMILIETMADPGEMKAAVLGAKEGCGLPVLATMTADGQGRLLTGGTVEAMAVMLDGLGVSALGLNCGLGGGQMLALVRRLRRVTDRPLLVQPNAGLPTLADGQTVFPDDPEAFAAHGLALARAGAWLLGGCCGTTPEHIRALRAACQGIAPLPLPSIDGIWVASSAQALNLALRPALVGERINPSGRRAMQEALRQGDEGWLAREAVRQQRASAQAIDINVGMPDIDEPAWMRRAVTAVQGVCTLPLQLDSADPAALEAGLRAVHGKALVNSVSGSRAVLDAVLPLARKYGGCVVGLLMDEAGVPDTAAGRLAIARRIVAACDDAGIRRRDILLDALAMTVSTGADNARVTLETVRRVKAELGVGTILGVSNASFGLPGRANLDAAFLAASIAAGLDVAIANPLQPKVMDAYCCALALTGHDAGCAEYVARFGGQAAGCAVPGEPSLEEAVYHGLAREAERQTAALLSAGKAPLHVAEGQLLPALARVGEDFEAGRLFLPQLMSAAQAAQRAFAVVEQALAAAGGRQAAAGLVALASVEGDVHDIGKNIVKVLLCSNGFEVLDLGRSVPPEEVLWAVRARHVRLVGLSALMTTTVPAMARTVALLHREAPWCRVAVGGAVLTRELAAQMGADAYVPDAMATVRYARQVLGPQSGGKKTD